MSDDADMGPTYYKIVECTREEAQAEGVQAIPYGTLALLLDAADREREDALETAKRLEHDSPWRRLVTENYRDWHAAAQWCGCALAGEYVDTAETNFGSDETCRDYRRRHGLIDEARIEEE